MALGLWHYANLATFAANCILNGVYFNEIQTLSGKYQVIVAAAGAAFAIWGIIYPWELVFVVAQMLEPLRDSKLIPIVSPWFCAAMTFQALWLVTFCNDLPVISFAFIFLDFVCLAGLGVAVDRQMGITTREFWFMRAPFSLHGGWIMCASAIGLSIAADASMTTDGDLLAIAIASLGVVLCLTALFAVGVIGKPDPIRCLVTAWATFFISVELRDPVLLINKPWKPVNFDEVTITGVRGAALILSYASLAFAALAMGLRVWGQNKAQALDAPKDQGNDGVLMAAVGA